MAGILLDNMLERIEHLKALHELDEEQIEQILKETKGKITPQDLKQACRPV